MAEDPFLPFMEEVPEIGDELKEVLAEVEDLKPSENSWQILNVFDGHSRGWKVARIVAKIVQFGLSKKHRVQVCDFGLSSSSLEDLASLSPEDLFSLYLEYLTFLVTSVVSEESLHIWGRRVADAIVVSAVFLLYFVYRYLIGYIDRGGSSGSLDFRDIYISIVLFQAAYVWIKFRDVIPRGAVYQRPGSSKWEPRIKFPVPRGMGVKSKRIPLGLYDTLAEGLVAYQIAAFYCKKRKHTGQLDLGGGAYFPIPALNVDPNLPYEEKVQQVGDQVLRVYAEFEKQKASRNLSPLVPGLALEMANGEGQLTASSPIQQLRQPLNLGMDSAMQCQDSQLGPNIHNGVDFNNPGSLLLLHAKTQHELLDAYKQIECLKAQVTRKEVESTGWEVKCLELERENGLLNHQIMQLQSQLQTQHEEQEFDTDRFLSMGHEESLAR